MDDEYFIEIDKWGNKHWRNKDGELHRLDGPAVEWPNGYKAWYENGIIHRIDGPAIERSDGYKDWWKNGIKFPDKDSFFESLTEKEKETVLFSTNFFID
jgi:hypothetical protein